nr:hypothetical protein BaRGS_018153 [Batillaria attramentaria]
MVNQLPRKYTDNPSAYEAFIRQFGTHYISEGKFGGVVMMHLETETSYFDVWDSRMPTTFAQPWLYSTKLNRISDLVRDATKRASLNQAISDYVMRTYLTVELRRVLQMLPFTVRNNREVTKLQNDINTKSTSVIKGWKSVHHDWWDTRTHKLKCCRVLDAQKNFYCWWTGYKNAIMDDMKVVATASRQIIRGVAGDHSDWHE